MTFDCVYVYIYMYYCVYIIIPQLSFSTWNKQLREIQVPLWIYVWYTVASSGGSDKCRCARFADEHILVHVKMSIIGINRVSDNIWLIVYLINHHYHFDHYFMGIFKW